MRPNESGVSFPIDLQTKEDAAREVYEHARSLGIEVGEQECLREVDYLEMVLEKNQYLNLTAVRDFKKGLILHLVDSLLYLRPMRKYCPFVEYENDTDEIGFVTFLDMGCGAGFPGIPLAIAEPMYRGLLCDSTKKKIAAVDEFVSKLGFEDRLRTSSERLEELPHQYRDGFAFVIVRALSSLPTLLEYAAPLLADDGVLVVSKGTPEESEVRRASRVETMVGVELIDREEYELPIDSGHRTLFIYGRTGEPRVRLPRAVGMATSQPLA